MGLMDDIQEEIKQRQDARITLREPITIDEVYTLMTERWDKEKYGNFKLSKFLFIKSIEFDDYMMMRYGVGIEKVVGSGRNAESITNNVVVVIPKPTSQSYSSLRKAQKEQVDAVLGKGFLRAIDRAELRKHELEHLQMLCNGMREVLHDKATQS